MEKLFSSQHFFGGSQRSIADIQAAIEIDMLKFLNYDLETKYPHVDSWMKKVIDDEPIMLKAVEKMR
jgi:glutathione S-transferase